MKSNLIYTAITACVCMAFLCSQAFSAESESILQAVGGYWHFGEVKQGQVHSGTFRLENKGSKPLGITKVNACCGYNITEISDWTIAPGRRSTVKVTCDATRKNPGFEEKCIKIGTDDPANPVSEIKIQSYIIAPAAPVATAQAAQTAIKPAAAAVAKPAVVKPAVVAAPEPEAEKIEAGDPLSVELSFKSADIKPPLKISFPKQDSIVPLITAARLNERILKGEKTVLLDVRERSEYLGKHIPDAVSFPKSRFAAGNGEIGYTLKNIDRGLMLVVYCGGGFRSNYIARKLAEAGYNAFDLEGGLKSWEEKKFPLVYGPQIPQEKEPLPMNLEEAYEHYFLLFKDSVLWIDARNSHDYKNGHIKGAINLPLAEAGKQMSLLPKDKEIVLYCGGAGCEQARTVGRLLIQNGFKQARVKVFEDGFANWAAKGCPIETN